MRREAIFVVVTIYLSINLSVGFIGVLFPGYRIGRWLLKPLWGGR